MALPDAGLLPLKLLKFDLGEIGSYCNSSGSDFANLNPIYALRLVPFIFKMMGSYRLLESGMKPAGLRTIAYRANRLIY